MYVCVCIHVCAFTVYCVRMYVRTSSMCGSWSLSLVDEGLVRDLRTYISTCTCMRNNHIYGMCTHACT